jgi:AcrR family transcriptional regulator
MSDSRRGSKGYKSQDILQAIFTAILERDFCNVSTQLIARKAGFTKSMLPDCFKDKEELMLETHKYTIQKTIATPTFSKQKGAISSPHKKMSTK